MLLPETWAKARRWSLWIVGVGLMLVVVGFVLRGRGGPLAFAPIAFGLPLAVIGASHWLGGWPKQLAMLRRGPRSWREKLQILLGIELPLLVMFAGLLGAQTLGVWTQTGKNPLSVWMFAPALVLGSFAMTLLAWGTLFRKGEERFCPKCGYRFGYEDEASAPEKCSECGLAWRGLLMTGRPYRAVWPTVIGVLLLVVAVVSPLAMSRLRSAYWQSRPVSERLMLPIDHEQWLSAFGLQVDPSLLPGVIDHAIADRRRLGHWGFAASFLSKSETFAAMSSEQVQAIMDLDLSQLEAVVHTPTGTGAGVSLRLRRLERAVSLSGWNYTTVAGFRVDDGPWQRLGYVPPLGVNDQEHTRINVLSKYVLDLPGTPSDFAGRRVTLRVHQVHEAYGKGPRGPTNWTGEGPMDFGDRRAEVRTREIEVLVP